MTHAAVFEDHDPARLVGGRYRIEERIGRGGMASVYRAYDSRLGRRVALKVLRPEILADPDLATRFRREAHAATVLRHPNLVACLDTGTDGGRPYLVMEMVDGEDLAARLRRDGRLRWEHAVRIGADVATGLGVAHARGFVHRDVKPGNILLAADGRAKVTDFGIARLDAEAEAALPGTTLGSVHYFSPEQAQGTTTTPASDVYSVGLVLFEALTGTRAFGGASPAAIAAARVGAAAPSPRAIEPSVPEWLDRIVRRALAPRPEERYPNGTILAHALDSAGRVRHSAAVQRPRPQQGVAARLGVLVAAVGVVGALLAAVAFVPGEGPSTLEPPKSVPTAELVAPTPVAVGVVADLCEPDDAAACPLTPGQYEPSTFRPAISFTLAEGWSAARSYEDAIVLERREGYLTIASDVRVLTDDGPQETDGARGLLAAIRASDEIRVLGRERITVAGRPADLLDVAPVGDDRVATFVTSADTFSVEVGTVTRFLVLDVDGQALTVVLEGVDGHGLADILVDAGPLLATLEVR